MHWIDPDSLPEIAGIFERFLINPHGDCDGLLLQDGQEVHFPPHMGLEVVAAVEAAPRARLRIRGVKPRGADVLAAVALETAQGRIEDRGPPHMRQQGPRHAPKPPTQPETLETEGVVRRALHGPRGETRGALLENGVIVRIPPHEAQRLAGLLKPGAKLAARGKGVASPYGVALEAHETGTGLGDLRAIDEPPRPPAKKPKHHREHDRHRPA